MTSESCSAALPHTPRFALTSRTSLNVKASTVSKTQLYSCAVIPAASGLGLRGDPIDELLCSIGTYSQRYIQSYRDSLSVILLEVEQLLASRPAESDTDAIYALCLPRQDEGFTPLKRYRLNAIGHTQWCRLIDDLVKAGMLEKVAGGYKTKDHFSGLTSCYAPTPALVLWLNQALPRLEIEKLQAHQERLILKKTQTAIARGKTLRRKVLLDYHDDEYTEGLRRQVTRVSEVCQAHRFEVCNAQTHAMERIPPTLLDYRRSFREDFKGGGRIFCLAQSLSKTLRKSLTIDGRPTVELDYQSHQIRMLYHLHGLDAESDCYAHPSLPRPLIKAATTRVMNCGTRRQALLSLTKLLSEKPSSLEPLPALPPDLTASFLLDSVLELNPILKQTMSEKLWRDLQYVESCIALGVMEGLAAEGYPCLGIHDSFRVPEDAGDLLRYLMREEYRKRLNYWPVVTRA